MILEDSFSCSRETSLFVGIGLERRTEDVTPVTAQESVPRPIMYDGT